jgi:hypothetical protein
MVSTGATRSMKRQNGLAMAIIDPTPTNKQTLF